MVARGYEILRQLAEEVFLVVMNAAGLAVHQLWRANHACAKGIADGLVPETHAQQRHFASEAPDHLHADTGLLRNARTWRDHDALRLHRRDFIERDLIVAAHFQLFTKLAEKLSQVVGER